MRPSFTAPNRRPCLLSMRPCLLCMPRPCPQADVKAHDKEVVGLVLACSQEDPEQPRLTLYTAGMDRSRSVCVDVVRRSDSQVTPDHSSPFRH